jgi:hypothetical protein
MSNYEYMANNYDPFDLELKHWKYIKKVKKNGKWVYFYDQAELDKYMKGETTETTNATGGTDTVHYSKTNKLLGSETKMSSRTYSGGTQMDASTTWKEQGKLDRAYAKAEKKVYDTVYKKDSVARTTLAKAAKKAKKGKSYVDRLFNIH